LQGPLNEQAKQFYQKGKNDPGWIEEGFMDFICLQLDRVKEGKITESTIRNYYKSTELFCEMNDVISINWKKIRRGLPKASHLALMIERQPSQRSSYHFLIKFL
jgi:hypothetical protein